VEASVVIATKDRRAFLERTLRSLQWQVGAPPFEIVVVDNGSTDDTRALVEGQTQQPVPVRYVVEPQPNRGKARNRGVELARGRYILFCDDDVWAPGNWIAAHLAAQQGGEYVVNGPILNVPSYESTPLPKLANYSRAFLCTCNASLSKEAFERAGGFDEDFELYGWEDTEFGVRLREAKYRWKFAWEAFLWHIKPAAGDALQIESRKAMEKARMARRFLDKHPSRRTRLATGAHTLNLLRARYLLPDTLLALYAGLATSRRVPAWLRASSRGQLLDGIYARELLRALDAEHGR
jgi:glycosyltransferase involved in cell wall biosynthesis